MTVSHVNSEVYSMSAPSSWKSWFRLGNGDGNPFPSNAQMTPASVFSIRNNDSVTIVIARWFDGSKGRMTVRSRVAAASADAAMAPTMAKATGTSRS